MIYNVGYAGKGLSEFIEMLKSFNISYLVDVRSVPFSGYAPAYNQPNLIDVLKENGLTYVYMGDLLGPRSKCDEHYKDDNQIDFEILAESELFKKGIERLRKADKYNVAIMCAEKVPEVCHRFLLVARYAERSGISVSSILFDQRVETFSQTQERLVKENKMEADFFTSEEELKEDVLDIYTLKHAYRREK